MSNIKFLPLLAHAFDASCAFLFRLREKAPEKAVFIYRINIVILWSQCTDSLKPNIILSPSVLCHHCCCLFCCPNIFAFYFLWHLYAQHRQHFCFIVVSCTICSLFCGRIFLFYFFSDKNELTCVSLLAYCYFFVIKLLARIKSNKAYKKKTIQFTLFVSLVLEMEFLWMFALLFVGCMCALWWMWLNVVWQRKR